MTAFRAINRRQFVATAAAIGGGLAVGFGPPVVGFRRAAAQAQAIELSHWVTIAPDNTVTLRMARVEMGQDTVTAQVQFLGEELEVDPLKIKTEFADLATHFARNRIYGSMNSTASRAVRDLQLPLRQAGAQVRTMLIKAAAARLNVPEGELAAENATVVHRASNRRLTYGELAADAAKIPPPDVKTLALKDAKDWKFIGKPMRPVAVATKVNGSAVFGIDVRLPGMKYAALQSSPVFKGKLKSHDARAALAMPGVTKVVEIKGGIQAGFVNDMDDAIAVVADTWWQAKTALDAMPKEWDGGSWATASSNTHMTELKAGLNEKATRTVRNDGDVDAAIKSAARVIEAEYFSPYLEHATMEPHNCTALVTDDRFELWVPTQSPETAMDVASKLTGVAVTKGKMNVMLLGGGFGRRGAADFVSQAVQIAKEMKGTPVKLVWTREETTRHSFYRASNLSRMRAGLDAQGNIVAWDHRTVAQNDSEGLTRGGSALLYNIPNMRLEISGKPLHVPLGALRGVAYAVNAFATQSFVDELAVATGKDHYQLHRALLDPDKVMAKVEEPSFETGRGLPPGTQFRTTKERTQRMRDVLDELAKRSDWGKPLGPNRGRGMAIEEETESVAAVAIEVTLDGAGWFTVDRAVVVADPGVVVNPNGAMAQLEGSVVWGLTAGLYQEITVNNGRVVQGNFDDYQILRINEMPKVEMHFVPNGKGYGGIGEVAVAPVTPALTNAIYNAGGPRVRALPIKNENIVKRT